MGLYTPKEEKVKPMQKSRESVQKLVEKALKINKETATIVDRFEQKGYEIENKDYLKRTLDNITRIANKPKPTQKDIELLKEYASVTQYDYIKVKIDLRQKEVDGITTTSPEDVNLGEVRKAIKRQVKLLDKLDDRDQQLVANYANAMSRYQNTQTPDLSTDQAKAKFKSKFSVSRDVSIGGSSTLLNDLAYTYDALSAGRKFVEMLQRVMSDPNNFVALESWYQNDPEGKATQIEIETAVGSYWYQGFGEFAKAIISAINKMPSLSKDAESLMNTFTEEMEIEADGEIYEY